jgi:hypothetical protein
MSSFFSIFGDIFVEKHNKKTDKITLAGSKYCEAFYMTTKSRMARTTHILNAFLT